MNAKDKCADSPASSSKAASPKLTTQSPRRPQNLSLRTLKTPQRLSSIRSPHWHAVLNQHAAQAAHDARTPRRTPKSAAEVDELVSPAFDPLFDAVDPADPGNARFHRGAKMPCPCTAIGADDPLPIDPATGLPPRSLSADVTKRYACGHAWTRKTRCDWACVDAALAPRLRWPRAHPRAIVRRTVFAPHPPVRRVEIRVSLTCASCRARDYATAYEAEVAELRARLGVALQQGGVGEDVEALREEIRSRERLRHLVVDQVNADLLRGDDELEEQAVAEDEARRGALGLARFEETREEKEKRLPGRTKTYIDDPNT